MLLGDVFIIYYGIVMASLENSSSLNRRLLGRHSSDRIETILSRLQEGTTMTRFYSSGRRPDNRTFRLKPHEFRLSWWRPPGKEDGSGRCKTGYCFRNGFTYFPNLDKL